MQPETAETLSWTFGIWTGVYAWWNLVCLTVLERVIRPRL